MPGPIPRLGKSDPGSLAAMEHVAAVANTGQFFSATGDMEAHATPSGRAILHTSIPTVLDRRIAVVTANSPGYTDPRYRLQVLAIVNSSVAGGAAPTPSALVKLIREASPGLFPEGSGGSASDTTGAAVGEFITAINLAECYSWTNANLSTAGTHLLIDQTGSAISTMVEAFCLYDDEANPRPHWFFCRPPAEVLDVALTTDGGADSSGGAPPTYTYSMTFGGVTLNTAQTPKCPRFGVLTSAAAFGYAHIDRAANKYVLGWANEVPGANACT